MRVTVRTVSGTSKLARTTAHPDWSRFGSGGALAAGRGFGSEGVPDQKDRRDGRAGARPDLHEGALSLVSLSR
jgi:hypothetical protein